MRNNKKSLKDWNSSKNENCLKRKWELSTKDVQIFLKKM